MLAGKIILLLYVCLTWKLQLELNYESVQELWVLVLPQALFSIRKRNRMCQNWRAHSTTTADESLGRIRFWKIPLFLNDRYFRQLSGTMLSAVQLSQWYQDLGHLAAAMCIGKFQSCKVQESRVFPLQRHPRMWKTKNANMPQCSVTLTSPCPPQNGVSAITSPWRRTL